MLYTVLVRIPRPEALIVAASSWSPSVTNPLAVEKFTRHVSFNPMMNVVAGKKPPTVMEAWLFTARNVVVAVHGNIVAGQSNALLSAVGSASMILSKGHREASCWT